MLILALAVPCWRVLWCVIPRIVHTIDEGRYNNYVMCVVSHTACVTTIAFDVPCEPASPNCHVPALCNPSHTHTHRYIAVCETITGQKFDFDTPAGPRDIEVAVEGYFSK